MKGVTQFKRPAINGVPLLTTPEVSAITGLSIWHLRDRANANRAGKRGAFIPSYKIGRSLFFHPDDVANISKAPKRVLPTAPVMDDCAWL